MPIGPISELVEFCCGRCKENNWSINLNRRSDGKTFLYITCFNKDCIEERRKNLSAGPDDLIVWEEIEITGGRYDMMPTSSTEKN
jgi:hypothetical protein